MRHIATRRRGIALCGRPVPARKARLVRVHLYDPTCEVVTGFRLADRTDARPVDLESAFRLLYGEAELCPDCTRLGYPLYLRRLGAARDYKREYARRHSEQSEGAQ